VKGELGCKQWFDGGVDLPGIFQMKTVPDRWAHSVCFCLNDSG
jgi:hypothetical protein